MPRPKRVLSAAEKAAEDSAAKRRKSERQQERRENRRVQNGTGNTVDAQESGPVLSKRERVALARQSESAEEKRNRLDQVKFYQQIKRENESDIEHHARLELLNLNRRNSRQARTSQERAEKLLELRKNKEKKYLNSLEYTTELAQVSHHYIGELNLKCVSCFAKHFPSDHHVNLKFSSCCEKGRVKIPPQENFPHLLRQLFKNEHPLSHEFKKDIRSYMRLLSMASIVTKEIKYNGGGPYTYRQVGDFQRKFNTSANPDPNQLPSYGQLFMVESDEATGIRYNLMSGLNKELLQQLDHIIRNQNPFAKSYKMLKEEEEKATALSGTTIPEFKILFCLKDHLDKRRFNPPRVNEVAVLFEQGADGEVPRYEICVNSHGKSLTTLKQTDKSAEPLLFSLFYPTGQLGWHPQYKSNEQKVTNHEYVKYKLYDREEADYKGFCPILYGGKCLQEWLCTQFLNIDRGRLDYIKNNVGEQLAEHYDYIEEYLQEKSAETGMQIGKKIVLPASYIGSPRYMTNAYEDALALTQVYGKPDLFITMTCSPDWPEIKMNLKAGQTASDRPDLVARVFRLKYKAMINYLEKSNLFGKVQAYTGSIEFQKRGLPHLHLLIMLNQGTKLDQPELIDELIRAEIPDEDTDPELYRIVTKNNMHQCVKYDRNGKIFKKFPCIQNENGKCSKNFPKKYLEETEIKTGGYANYRRRKNEATYTAPDSQVLDNRHVVPYSPHLSKKFNCHINVEHVADIEVVKYLHKYVFKGVDQALVERVSRDGTGNELIYDEVKRYIECRYLSAPEAAWRTLGYEIIVKSHAVERLEIHTEGKQFIYFDKKADQNKIANLKENKKSKLMGFFDLNQENSKKLLYSEIPQHYVWDAKNYRWNERKRHVKVVGRIYNTSPKDSERFHLRLLLLRIRGPKSFEDLKTVDGEVHTTFKKACLARGFIKDDQDYFNAMEEASNFKMPRQLRIMFSMLLIHCDPTMPLEIYNRFKKSLSEDCLRKYGDPQGYDVAYNLIEKILNRNERSFANYEMPSSNVFTDEQLAAPDYDPETDKVEEYKQLGDQLYESCNCDQKTIISTIMSMLDGKPSKTKCIFLDGPGGTGKTFVYKAIYNMIKGRGKTVFSMAYTGIAAILLPQGNTVHTTFKFGLDVDENTRSNLSKRSKQWTELANATAFIIDEASMISRYVLEAIDRSLRDFTGKNIPFGGKIMLLGGDFRQILPIKENAIPQQTLRLSLKGSSLWSHFKILRLTQNMRAGADNLEFSKKILEIGERKLNDSKDMVELPQKCFVGENLVSKIFGAQINDSNKQKLAKRTILAPLNVEVDDLNDQVLRIVEGNEEVYFSRDEIKEEDNGKYNYMIEMLNSLNEPNFPKYELKLKVNAVVMILRNLDLKEGLCNGTRLRIVELKPNVLKCETLTGEKAGSIVFIPRITLQSTKNLIIPFCRNQFPVRLAFAMTINKSQGQTFDAVGLKLDKRQVFSHGQLYVAISRVKNWDCLHIQSNGDSNLVENVVYEEIL